MKYTKIMRAKAKVEECLRCCNCGDIVFCCDRCGQDLVIELGCDYDFMCDGRDHICQDCVSAQSEEQDG